MLFANQSTLARFDRMWSSIIPKKYKKGPSSSSTPHRSVTRALISLLLSKPILLAVAGSISLAVYLDLARVRTTLYDRWLMYNIQWLGNQRVISWVTVEAIRTGFRSLGVWSKRIATKPDINLQVDQNNKSTSFGQFKTIQANSNKTTSPQSSKYLPYTSPCYPQASVPTRLFLTGLQESLYPLSLPIIFLPRPIILSFTITSAYQLWIFKVKNSERETMIDGWGNYIEFNGGSSLRAGGVVLGKWGKGKVKEWGATVKKWRWDQGWEVTSTQTNASSQKNEKIKTNIDQAAQSYHKRIQSIHENALRRSCSFLNFNLWLSSQNESSPTYYEHQVHQCTRIGMEIISEAEKQFRSNVRRSYTIE